MRELIVVLAKLALARETLEINLPASKNKSEKEAEIYAENTALFLSLASVLEQVFSDFSRLTKFQRQRTYSLQDCTFLLKKLSQLRLGVGYLTEEIAAHEESIRVSVRAIQRQLRTGRWSPQSRRTFVNPMELGLKDYTLHLLVQKSPSLRSMSPVKGDFPKAKTERLQLVDGQYSNVSNLYLENVWRKGQGLKRPSSKYRFVKENRAARALDRALNSGNRELANSVRQLMSKFGPIQQKTYS